MKKSRLLSALVLIGVLMLSSKIYSQTTDVVTMQNLSTKSTGCDVEMRIRYADEYSGCAQSWSGWHFVAWTGTGGGGHYVTWNLPAGAKPTEFEIRSFAIPANVRHVQIDNDVMTPTQNCPSGPYVDDSGTDNGAALDGSCQGANTYTPTYQDDIIWSYNAANNTLSIRWLP
ncbi:MAG: hypothetical protein CL840_13545 [Crocinitomicaceae bacterium]|nr:hypothetical protein [Crocinitomicaceae bacterium]|tara:strand:+ start:17221 stop:17736 length:516 start_codon:yes stop_codon:yes gene_type:complete